MEKRTKIIIVIILVAVIAVTGYLTYATYASEYDNNIKKAYETQELLSKKVDNLTDMGNKVDNKSIDYKEGVQQLTKYDKEIINLTETQLKYLKQAKQFATTDSEKKYIDSLIKNSEELKEVYELNSRFHESLNNSADSSGNIPLGDLMIVVNKQDKVDDKIIELDKSRDEIKNFLNENPEFEERLKKLGLKYEFLGVKRQY